MLRCAMLYVCVLQEPNEMPRDHREPLSQDFSGLKTAKLMIVQDSIRVFF